VRYEENVTKHLATVTSTIDREYYLRNMSNDFNISLDTLVREVKKHRRHTGGQKDKSDEESYANKVSSIYQSKKLRPAYFNAERQLIAHILQDRRIAEQGQEAIGASFHVE